MGWSSITMRSALLHSNDNHHHHYKHHHHHHANCDIQWVILLQASHWSVLSFSQFCPFHRIIKEWKEKSESMGVYCRWSMLLRHFIIGVYCRWSISSLRRILSEVGHHSDVPSMMHVTVEVCHHWESVRIGIICHCWGMLVITEACYRRAMLSSRSLMDEVCHRWDEYVLGERPYPHHSWLAEKSCSAGRGCRCNVSPIDRICVSWDKKIFETKGLH